MHVRLYERADMPIITDILYDAFLDDELSDLLWPLRYEHPESFRQGKYLRTKLSAVTPATYTLVCVADAGDITLNNGKMVQPGEIMGVGRWQRNGPGPDTIPNKPVSATMNDLDAKRCLARHQAHNTSPACALERLLLGTEVKYTELLHLDRSMDYKKWARYAAAERPLRKLPGCWQLTLTAVAPAHQRKGVGAALVKWGQDRAREEGVPAAMSSSWQGAGLYQKLGFLNIDWMPAGLEAGWRGGQCFVWDPWGIWVRKLEKERVGRGGRMVDGEYIE